jgi:sec-independent protein translocase protein TatA
MNSSFQPILSASYNWGMQQSSLGSPIDILIIALVFVLLFGGSKLAGLGKGLGESIKNFKTAIKEDDGTTEDEKSKTKS